MASDGAPADPQAARVISDLQFANNDLYDRAAAIQSANDLLTAELNTVKAQLNEQKRDTESLKREVADQTNTIAQLNAAAESEKRILARTRTDWQEARASRDEAKRLAANLDRQIKQEAQRRHTLQSDRDKAVADNNAANQRVDALTKQLALAKRNRDAHDFLQSIRKELEGQFKETGTAFTPDGVIGHIRRMSQQAAINRNVSGDSNSSDQQNAGPSSNGNGRRSLGARTTSNIAQELDDAAARDDSNSSDQQSVAQSTNGNARPSLGARTTSNTAQELDDATARDASVDETSPEGLRVIKQRGPPADSSVQSVSPQTVSPKDEKIRKQEERIEWLEKKIDVMEKAPVVLPVRPFSSTSTPVTAVSKTSTDLTAVSANSTPSTTFATTADRLKHAKKAQPKADPSLLFQSKADSSSYSFELAKAKAANETLQQDMADQVKKELAKALKEAADERKSRRVDQGDNTDPVAPSPTPVVASPNSIRYVDRYVEKVRDSTIYEAFRNSSPWLQVPLAFLICFLLYFGLSGYYTDRMWLAANNHYRYNQADYAILGNVYQRLEGLTGYNSQLLG